MDRHYPLWAHTTHFVTYTDNGCIIGQQEGSYDAFLRRKFIVPNFNTMWGFLWPTTWIAMWFGYSHGFTGCVDGWHEAWNTEIHVRREKAKKERMKREKERWIQPLYVSEILEAGDQARRKVPSLH
jgi:hypothetical protein